jgi:WD40 repeat protein
LTTAQSKRRHSNIEATSKVHPSYLSLPGHGNWVTCLQVGQEKLEDGSVKDFVVSGSRDKSVMIWDIYDKNDDSEEFGVPRKILKGKLKTSDATYRSRPFH